MSPTDLALGRFHNPLKSPGSVIPSPTTTAEFLDRYKIPVDKHLAERRP